MQYSVSPWTPHQRSGGYYQTRFNEDSEAQRGQGTSSGHTLIRNRQRSGLLTYTLTLDKVFLMNTHGKPCSTAGRSRDGETGVRFVSSFSKISRHVHCSRAAPCMCPCSLGSRRASATTGLKVCSTEDEKVRSGLDPAGLQRTARVGKEEEVHQEGWMRVGEMILSMQSPCLSLEPAS